MLIFAVWHGECATFFEAEIRIANSAAQAAEDLPFKRQDGSSADGITYVTQSPKGLWLATRDGSTDYFYLIERT